MALSSAPLRSGEQEIDLLVTLLRLSRVTLLYGETPSETSRLLRSNLVPQLQATARKTEVIVLFDAWDDAPVHPLLSRLREAVASVAPASAQIGAPLGGSMAESLIAWQQAFDVSFLIILDRFEKYLATSSEAEGIRHFEQEFVKVLNAPTVKANFVIALNERSAPLLCRLRDRVPGFDDTSVRLSPLSQRAGQPSESRKDDGPAGSHAPIFHGSERNTAEPASLDAPANNAPQIVGRDSAESTDVEPAGPPGLHVPEDKIELTASSSSPGAESGRSARAHPSRLTHVAASALLISLLSLLALSLWDPAEPTPTPTSAQTEEPSTRTPRAVVTSEVASQDVKTPASDHVRRRSEPAGSRQEDTNRGLAAGAESAASPAPALYIHVRDEGQRKRAYQMVDPLAKRGIRISGIKVVSSGPREPDLRYFRSGEAAEAAQVRRTLRDIGFSAAGPKLITGFERTAPPRQYELWLAPTGFHRK
jgi:hypothetical protein